jgi:hypothetical protein
LRGQTGVEAGIGIVLIPIVAGLPFFQLAIATNGRHFLWRWHSHLLGTGGRAAISRLHIPIITLFHTGLNIFVTTRGLLAAGETGVLIVRHISIIAGLAETRLYRAISAVCRNGTAIAGALTESPQLIHRQFVGVHNLGTGLHGLQRTPIQQFEMAPSH